MWLIPTRKQWTKWSLPSKITSISALIGLIGLILTVIFQYSSSKGTIGIDNTKKALEYLDKAKRYQAKDDYVPMLSNSRKAFEFEENIATTEYLALSYLLNKKSDSALQLLVDYENKITVFGKWILATSLGQQGKFSEAFKYFEKFDISTVPIEIRIKALDAYVSTGYFISREKLLMAGQNIINYVTREISKNTNTQTTTVLQNNSEVELFSFEANAVTYLPGMYFRIGYLIFNIGYKDNSISPDDFALGLKYIHKGFASGLLSFSSTYYLNIISELQIIINQWKGTGVLNYKDIILTLKTFKAHLENALNNQVNSGVIIVTKKFTDEDYSIFRKSINIIDSIINDKSIIKLIPDSSFRKN